MFKNSISLCLIVCLIVSSVFSSAAVAASPESSSGSSQVSSSTAVSSESFSLEELGQFETAELSTPVNVAGIVGGGTGGDALLAGIGTFFVVLIIAGAVLGG